MNAYVYHWTVRPRPEICMELQIEAASAIDARRELFALLGEHRTSCWQIQIVSRSQRSFMPWMESASRLLATCTEG